MSNAMKLAMTFTAIDAASSVVMGLEKRILRLGHAGQQVKKDFDDMVSHTRAGLKSLAAEKYLFNAIKPGVKHAADLQESLIEMRMLLKTSGKDAGVLSKEMRDVRDSANTIQKTAIGGSKEAVNSMRIMMKPLQEFESVVGTKEKGYKGAAWSAMHLATIVKEQPETVATAMTDIAVPFKLKGDQFPELADHLQRIWSVSNTTIGELMEGMKYAAPAAKTISTGNGEFKTDAGITWKDAITAMGVLSEHGLKGSVAGTGLKDFIVRLTGAFRSGEDWIKVLNLKFFEGFDERGNIKNLPSVIAEMREKIGGMGSEKSGVAVADIMGLKGKKRKQMLEKYKKHRELAPKLKDLSPKERTEALVKIWGMEGMPAAAALMDTGMGSWEAVSQKAAETAPLEEKIAMRMEGLNATLESLEGTWQSALANVFDPMLSTLTAIANKGTDAADAVGKLADQNKTLTNAFNIGIGAAGVGLAGYGGYRLLRGGLAGRRVLRGLIKGTGSLAAGVAEGKVLQAAGGVTPVFIVGVAPGAFDRGGLTPGLSSDVAGGSPTPAKSAKPTLLDSYGRPVVTSAAAGAASSVATGMTWAGIAGLGAATFASIVALAIASNVVNSHIAEKQHMKPEDVANPNDFMGLGAFVDIERQQAERIAQAVQQVKPEVKNNINLSIHVDQAGRSTSTSSDLNTATQINLERGDFMGP